MSAAREHAGTGAKKAKLGRQAAAKAPAHRGVSVSPELARELYRTGGGDLVVVQGAPGAGDYRPIGRLVIKARSGEPTVQIAPIANDQRADIVKSVAPSAFEPDARARALLRGREIAEEDLRAAGGAFSMEETQALLGHVSRQTVHRKIAQGEIISLTGPKRRRVFPTIQFTREGLIPGVREVLAAFPSKNAWAVLNFLINPNDRLAGRKPIDLLRAGDADLVANAARTMGMQGA